MRYEPGRRYVKAGLKKGKAQGYLREERIEGVPASFRKLNSFIKERKRDLALFVNATTEKCKCGSEDGVGLPVAMEVEVEEEDIVDPQNIGPTGHGNSDDEEYYTDDVEDEGDSD